MTEHHRRHRRPAAFRLDDDRVTVSPVRAPERDIGSAIQVVPEPDAFAVPVPVGPSRDLPRRGFRWGALFWCAAGGLVLLAIALGIFDLLKDFFARNVELGWLGLALACLAAVSLAVIGIRETAGLMRLANVEHLHQRAADVIATDDRDTGTALVKDLIALTHRIPRLARARANLQGHLGDIIDGADLVRLTERELMAPLDQEARGLITASVMRVSVVTAVSSRASIDMLFVLITFFNLLRRLSYLYGVRPGTLGLVHLLRLVISHLALTGGLATSDSLIQQILGHGIAAKLSARLGEGLLNGLLTARLGLAAIDVVRPLPFAALPRPTLSDLMSEALRGRDDADEVPRLEGADVSPKGD
ncbi:MAG TPA: TIGR01620 family protein [Xanthobacteraceae bacterium]|jgi:putative membrane protein|nr:TIGR01620 family protein [Xanthobacteraceae bacterium]